MPNEVLQPINIHLSNLEVGREYTTSFSIANTGLISTSTLLNPAVTGFSYTANNPTQNLSSLLIRNTDDVAVVVRVSTVDSEGHHYDKDLLLLAPDYYTQNCYAPPVYSVDVSDSSYVQSQDLVISTQDFTPPAQYEDVDSDDIDPEVINFRVAASYSASNTETFPVRISALPTPEQLGEAFYPVGTTVSEFPIVDGQYGERVVIGGASKTRVYQRRSGEADGWDESEEVYYQIQGISSQSLVSVAAITLSSNTTWYFIVYKTVTQEQDQGFNIATFFQQNELGRANLATFDTQYRSAVGPLTAWFSTYYETFSPYFGRNIIVNDTATRFIVTDHSWDNGRGAIFIFDKFGGAGTTAQHSGFRCGGKPAAVLEETLRNLLSPNSPTGLETVVDGVIWGEEESGLFGYDVACNASGSRVVVVSPDNNAIDGYQGRVTAYEYDSLGLYNNQWVKFGNVILGEDGYRAIHVDMNELGNRIAVAWWDVSSYDHYVRVYDIKGSNPQPSFNTWTQVGEDIPAGSDSNFYSVKMNSEGTRVVLGNVTSTNGDVVVYDLVNDRWVQSFSEITGAMSTSNLGSRLTLNKDGTMFVASSKEQVGGVVQNVAKAYDISATASEPSTDPGITTDPEPNCFDKWTTMSYGNTTYNNNTKVTSESSNTRWDGVLYVQVVTSNTEATSYRIKEGSGTASTSAAGFVLGEKIYIDTSNFNASYDITGTYKIISSVLTGSDGYDYYEVGCEDAVVPDPEPDTTPDPEPDPTPDPEPAPEDGAEDTPSPSPEVPRGYIVNGVNNKTITLVRGRKYTFNLDIPGHPMYIQTSAAEGYDPQSAYVLHSSMNGKSVGDYTFTVPSDAPDTLWYQCRFHETMQGRILIVNPE